MAYLNPEEPAGADDQQPAARAAALSAEVTDSFDRIFAIFQADIAADLARTTALSINTGAVHSAQRARPALS
jgi:hypothetical protein